MTASPPRPQWRLRLSLAGLALALLPAGVAAETRAEPRAGDASVQLPSARLLAAATSPSQTIGVPIPDGQIEQAIDRLDILATEMLERSGIPGLAVAVVREGETVHAKGYGLRKMGAPEAVDADTVFQIASLSKPVGATVVAAQVAAGQVAWDMPVVEQLPWFALADDWVTRKVTIGDLYAHRSGLPDHAGDALEDLGYDRREVLERLRFLPLHPFRAHYAYTNFGLTAAAEAVAVAAGMDWAELSEQSLYAPLGMTATSSRFEDFAARGNRAHGHVPGADGYAPLHVRQPDAQSPAGGVSASVADLAKWMAMVLQEGRHDGQQVIAAEALLPAVTAQVISAPSRTPDARPGHYGFGFNVGTQPSGRVSLSHSGAFALGWASNFVMLPSVGVGIVVLSNALPTGAVEALAMEFADLVQYGEVTRDWLAGYGALMAQMLGPVGRLVATERPAAPAAPAARAAYVGRYGSAYFGDALVADTAEGLVLEIGPAAMRLALEHWDGDVFTYIPGGENAPPGSISQVTFQRPGSGPATALTIEFLDENGLGTFQR